jgi:hypothetical protein
MVKLQLAWLVVLSFLLVGCAHTSSESTVNADGSWSRSLKLSVGKSMGDDKWMDIFAMPGADWNKAEEIKDSEKIITLKRNFKPDEGPVTDIIVREKGVTKLKNFVMVRKLEGNRLEYYEKIVFTSTDTEKQAKELEQYIQEMKKVMPPGKATDEDYKAMSKKTGTSLMRVLFGPDDHLFGTLLLNPDGAVRRLRAKLGQVESKILAEQMGDRMTQAERDNVVKQLLKTFDSSNSILNNKKPSGPTDSTTQSQADLLGMSVAVKLPGKIIETNGEIDSYSGEVFWDFASNSAEPDVLELRAICQL